MYEEENTGYDGIQAELLVEDLQRRGAGYVMEVTTSDTPERVVTERHHTDEKETPAEGELDFGSIREINDRLGTDLSDEHCIDIYHDGETMTIYAEGDRLISVVDSDDEVETYNHPSELVNAIDGFIRR